MTAPVRVSRRLVVVISIGATVAIMIAGIIWWRERALAEAELALEANQPIRALRLAEDHLRSHPGHGRASAIRARALVATGRHREAVELFETVGAATADDLHAWARALLLEGRWESARLLLEQVVLQEPQHADALHELTACYANVGRYEKAIETAQRFAALPGLEARGDALTGTLYRDMGNQRQAANAYARVLEREPDAEGLQVGAAEFFDAYGLLLLDLGEPKQAAELFKRSLAVNSTAVVHSDLGRAYEQLGQLEDAEQAWRQALAIDPREPVAREGLAAAALGRGEPHKAVEWLLPVADRPGLSASTAYLIQRALAAAGDTASANEWQERTESLRTEERRRAAVNRILLDAPDSAWAAVVRAYRFAEVGNWGEAETQLRDVPPDDPFIVDLRNAIRTRGPLPSLNRLPISRF